MCVDFRHSLKDREQINLYKVQFCNIIMSTPPPDLTSSNPTSIRLPASFLKQQAVMEVYVLGDPPSNTRPRLEFWHDNNQDSPFQTTLLQRGTRFSQPPSTRWYIPNLSIPTSMPYRVWLLIDHNASYKARINFFIRARNNVYINYEYRRGGAWITHSNSLDSPTESIDGRIAGHAWDMFTTDHDTTENINAVHDIDTDEILFDNTTYINPDNCPSKKAISVKYRYRRNAKIPWGRY